MLSGKSQPPRFGKWNGGIRRYTRPTIAVEAEVSDFEVQNLREDRDGGANCIGACTIL